MGIAPEEWPPPSLAIRRQADFSRLSSTRTLSQVWRAGAFLKWGVTSAHPIGRRYGAEILNSARVVPVASGSRAEIIALERSARIRRWGTEIGLGVRVGPPPVDYQGTILLVNPRRGSEPSSMPQTRP